jgi:hypothetical protein
LARAAVLGPGVDTSLTWWVGTSFSLRMQGANWTQASN